ncbi:MAG: hypothetical protein AVDCRST_MAG19-1711, partial [uncultured Thermomicrobiales bacterium]
GVRPVDPRPRPRADGDDAGDVAPLRPLSARRDRPLRRPDRAVARLPLPVLPDRAQRADDPGRAVVVRVGLAAGDAAVGQSADPVREHRRADGDRAAQFGDHRGREPGAADPLRGDGRLRAGADPGPWQGSCLRRHPLDADGAERGDLRPELRAGRQSGARQHHLGHPDPGAVQRLRDLPLPAVLSRLPGRDRGGGAARRPRLHGDLLAAAAAELGRHPDGARNHLV